MIEITGGEAVAQMLAGYGVGPMFGMGGFQLLPLYDGIRRLGLEHHLINDERCGAFAADAYARVSGRPGVCDATLGPGATNLVTALVESLNAGIPIVAIVGDSHRGYAGRNMTQETHQAEILRPVCKELIRVEQVERIPELMRRAFAVATRGRPGPVIVAVPEDIAHARHGYSDDAFWVDPTATSIPATRPRPDAGAVSEAASLLDRSERPLILAGGGVHLSGACGALLEFAETQQIPIAHTMSGKGSIACTHALSTGLFGRYDRYSNALIDEADCLLVVGSKLGEVATRRYALPPPTTPLIHLDLAADELGRWTRSEVALWGDARAGLLDLLAELTPSAAVREARARFVDGIAQRRAAWAELARPRYTSDERPVNMARVIGELNQLIPSEGILVADGGFASHWAGLLYDVKRSGRGFIADRGFASIGYGLPGAIGASLARPGAPVVGITGDGGMNMTIGELETARRVGAGLTLVVVNNGASGYVKALQHAVYGAGNYQSADLSPVDYAALARAFGCGGIRVEDPADLSQAIRAGLDASDEPTIIDVVVTNDPAQMLPAADSRTLHVSPGDRPV